MKKIPITHDGQSSYAYYHADTPSQVPKGILVPVIARYVEVNGQKYVVDGHHRLRAAKDLGMKEVPVEKVELPYKGYKTIEDLFGI